MNHTVFHLYHRYHLISPRTCVGSFPVVLSCLYALNGVVLIIMVLFYLLLLCLNALMHSTLSHLFLLTPYVIVALSPLKEEMVLTLSSNPSAKYTFGSLHFFSQLLSHFISQTRSLTLYAFHHCAVATHCRVNEPPRYNVLIYRWFSRTRTKGKRHPFMPGRPSG